MEDSIRYHLIGNPERGDSLDELRNMTWEDGIVMCTRHSWIWPVYCRLKMSGHDVTFSYDIDPDAINIIHGQVARGLLKAKDIKNNFIVGIRADFRPFPYGQFEIVQNETTAGGRRIYISHLPQPGLISRDTRREQVQNVCFSGRYENTHDVKELEQRVKKIGLQFVFKGEGEWQDMYDVDILLGIRSLSKKAYHDKPPSKLFNAWLAGIPFIGGYDSAYSQVGHPGRDYLRVSSEEELIQSLEKLKDDPALFASLVENGRKAVQSYTAEQTTMRWEAFLGGPAEEAFRRWRAGDRLMHMQSGLRAQWYHVYEQTLKKAASKVRESLSR